MYHRIKDICIFSYMWNILKICVSLSWACFVFYWLRKVRQWVGYCKIHGYVTTFQWCHLKFVLHDWATFCSSILLYNTILIESSSVMIHTTKLAKLLKTGFHNHNCLYYGSHALFRFLQPFINYILNNVLWSFPLIFYGLPPLSVEKQGCAEHIYKSIYCSNPRELEYNLYIKNYECVSMSATLGCAWKHIW